MMHSASTTVIPNFFLYSSTESPSHLTDSCFRTPSASFCPLLLARTHDWRVMRKPKGSLKTTTGCRCPMTKNSHPSNGGEGQAWPSPPLRSEEHTSELQSRSDLVCRLLLEKKKT